MEKGLWGFQFYNSLWSCKTLNFILFLFLFTLQLQKGAPPFLLPVFSPRSYVFQSCAPYVAASALNGTCSFKSPELWTFLPSASVLICPDTFSIFRFWVSFIVFIVLVDDPSAPLLASLPPSPCPSRGGVTAWEIKC